MRYAFTCVVQTDKVKSLIVPATILCACLSLSACALGPSNAIDTALTNSTVSIADNTPSIAVDPFANEKPKDASQSDRLLDEDTIRLAVTAADLSKISSEGLAWANEATGSSGQITELKQRQVSGQACRSFEATRQSYDGATLYEGDVCLDKRSGWWTRVLKPVENS